MKPQFSEEVLNDSSLLLCHGRGLKMREIGNGGNRQTYASSAHCQIDILMTSQRVAAKFSRHLKHLQVITTKTNAQGSCHRQFRESYAKHSLAR